MIVLGVDPGGKTTGLCLCDGTGVVTAGLIDRSDLLFDDYLRTIIDTITGMEAVQDVWLRIAVEDVLPPNPHMGMSNVKGILDTAQVIGAIRVRFAVALIRPGGHGSRPIQTYPPRLVGPREGKAGGGKLRHVRSAYDIAQTFIREQNMLTKRRTQ